MVCILSVSYCMVCNLSVSYCMVCTLSVSYCMVCEYVREDNQRALASGLSPAHTHNHTIKSTSFSEWIIPRTYAQPYNNFLIAPACMYTLYIVRYLM